MRAAAFQPGYRRAFRRHSMGAPTIILTPYKAPPTTSFAKAASYAPQPLPQAFATAVRATSPGMSTGMKVGIGVVVVTLAGGAAYYFLKMQKKR